ncbi:MAG TPA: TetR/AcrR family transcriptional regulator [Herpetosiphonaceae bacterium]
MTEHEPTKKRLIDTMMLLIQRQGYHATGISQVLAESKAPKGVLYHHFPGGKTELAAAAVRQAGGYIIARLERLMAESADPVEGFSRFVRHYQQQLRETDYVFGCPIATLALETAASIDALQREVKAIFGQMGAVVARMLAASGLDDEAAAIQSTLLIALFEGALLLSKAQRDPAPLEAAIIYLERQLRPQLPGPPAAP